MMNYSGKKVVLSWEKEARLGVHFLRGRMMQMAVPPQLAVRIF
jgi:hypothetical protein